MSLTQVEIYPLRKTRKLTQEQLGQKAGIHPRTIGQIENSKHPAKPEALQRIEDALAAPNGEQWTGSDCRREREAAGLSIRELATLARVGFVTLHTFETGQRRTYESGVTKIRAALRAAAAALPNPITPGTLRTRRLERRVTMAELAKAAGLSVYTIQATETGRHSPRPRTVKKLTEALDRIETANPITSGSELRQRRRAEGLTLEKLADRSGLSLNTIHVLETEPWKPLAAGRRPRGPWPRTLRAVERVLAGGVESMAVYPGFRRGAKRIKRRVAGDDGAALPLPEHMQRHPRKQGSGGAKRGRKPSAETQEVNKFCYEQFLVGTKLTNIFRNAVERFGTKRAPKSQNHAYEKARRYALSIGATLPSRQRR
jgi:transcriptional regulator with XRE-family HTH domain